MNSYPYLSDILNGIFGTQVYLPIAMFGTFVAIALVVGTLIASKEFRRYEYLNFLPKSVNVLNKTISPHELLPDLVMVCAVFGIIGARIFHILDYPSEFASNPIGMIFTRSGFSIYGGLVFGVIAGGFFLKRYSIPIRTSLDAVAPAMILGYGIGRIGCQISGDGAWGVASNMSLKPEYLPDWLWAQTYENNIAGVVIPEPGVYPTPIYEFLAACAIFFFLWSIRKQVRVPGNLFSIYLILSGFQRLLIEKIRINKELAVFDYSFTQAELISTALILVGLVGALLTRKSRTVRKVGFSLIVIGALTTCASL